ESRWGFARDPGSPSGFDSGGAGVCLAGKKLELPRNATMVNVDASRIALVPGLKRDMLCSLVDAAVPESRPALESAQGSRQCKPVYSLLLAANFEVWFANVSSPSG